MSDLDHGLALLVSESCRWQGTLVPDASNAVIGRNATARRKQMEEAPRSQRSFRGKYHQWLRPRFVDGDLDYMLAVHARGTTDGSRLAARGVSPHEWGWG